LLHGVSFEQFNSLSEATQHGFEMEIDLVIQMVIFKYFSPHAKPERQAYVLANKKCQSVNSRFGVFSLFIFYFE
jgi:hypothetical protein